MFELVLINECQFITFEGLSTTFKASTNVSKTVSSAFVIDIHCQ